MHLSLALCRNILNEMYLVKNRFSKPKIESFYLKVKYNFNQIIPQQPSFKTIFLFIKFQTNFIWDKFRSTLWFFCLKQKNIKHIMAFKIYNATFYILYAFMNVIFPFNIPVLNLSRKIHLMIIYKIILI